MSANLVATAPTGFEVSSDGTTYGSTATFTQSGGSASGTLRVRLAATAAVGGSYNSQNIVLSSTGANSVNITTPSSGNTVSAKALTITGLNAANKNWDGTTTATVTGTPTYVGLANGQSFSVTGAVTWAFADANAGAGKVLTRTGSYDAPSANYTVTQPSLSADILAIAASAPTISSITGGNGQLSVAFTAPSSNGGASITNYEYSLNGGSSWVTPSPAVTSSPLVITGLSNGTSYDVQIRAVNSAGSGTASATTTASPTAPSSPTITVNPALLSSPLTTTYGTASSAASFTVSGVSLTGDLTVTAPAGMEVSSGGAYGNSVTLTATDGVVGSTTIQVRLKNNADVGGSYNSATIAVSGGGATTQNVSTTASGNAVSALGLTISGLTGANREYDGSTSASVTGTATLNGVLFSDDVSLSGTPSFSFATKTAANGKAITASGYSLSGAKAGNYTVAQPTGLTANVTQKALAVTGASVTSKTYDGTTTATITGATLVGVIGADVVTVSGGGAFADANAGSDKAVTASLSLGGADAANYSLTQPTLTGTINKANQTITFSLGANATKFANEAAFAISATSSVSSLTAGITFSSSATGVATVSVNTVTLVAAGTTTLTASSPGDSNYNAATATQTLSVSPMLNAGDIAVIQYDSDDPDKFTFVTLVDLAPGTTINFTDNGMASATTGGTGEGFLSFTVPSGTSYPKGSTFTWTSGMVITGTPWSSSTALGLSTSGDQIFVFQGPTANWASQTGILLISGYMPRASWITTGAISTNTSYQPSPDLLSASFITFFASTQDNGYFANSTSTAVSVTLSGLKSQLQTLIFDATKWYKNSTGPLTSPTYTFTVLESQSITFGSLAGQTYGDSTFNLSATASSGLTVSYTSSNTGVATVSGSTVTIVGAGSTTITASQSGNGSFAAASSVNQTLTVSRKAVTVTAAAKSKTYGNANPALTFGASGLVGADTLTGSLATSATSSSSVGTYAITQGTVNNANNPNYNIIYTSADLTVNAKALTITANNVTKVQGTTLTGGAGSTGFTSSGLVGSETIGSVTIAYGSGAAAEDVAGTYTGSVTPSAATGGTFTASNYSISYVAGDLTVSAEPVISTVGSLSAMSTTYGTSSSAGSFTVTGGFLTGDLTVTAPAGFEVSSGGAYSSSLTLAHSSGTVGSTTISVRLAAATGFGSYSGNVTVSGGGATSKTVAVASSSVAKKALTITGLNPSSRVYDGTTAVSVSGSPTYSGLVNDENHAVTDTITWTFGNKTVGNGKVLVASGNFSAPTANYSVTQPVLSADITAKELTLSAVSVSNKVYDGTTTATISGTLSGALEGDTVALSGGGAFASANVGTGIEVTASLTAGGADGANYTFPQPTGLSADITPKALTVTANNVAKNMGAVLTGGSGSTAFTSSGLVGSETIGSVTIAYGSAGAATGDGAVPGIYAGQVVPSAATGGTFSPANYTINYVAGSIQVRGFTRGNLIVNRIGDGTTVLSGNASKIGIVELTTAGSLVQVVDGGVFEGSNLLTDTGSSGSNGFLNSYGAYVAVPGYNSALTTATVVNLNTKAANILGYGADLSGRGVMPTDGSIYSGSNFRSAIPTGANTFYTGGTTASGSSAGVWYYNGTSFVQISTTISNVRMLGIYNGDLYFSTGSGTTTRGIYKVGSGLPTTTGQTATQIVATGSASSPYEFAISPDGNTVYVADDNTTATGGGLQKWVKSGATWSLAYTIQVPVRGLAVDFSQSPAVAYATTLPTSGSALNSVVKIVDTGAGATPETIASSGANYVFRGVDFAPAPNPAVVSTGSLSAVSTTYGTASSATTVAVSGSNLLGPVTATAPAGFEVSSDGVNFGNTASFSPTAGSVSGTLSVRLTANAAATSYSGNVTLSTYWHYGTVSSTVATAASSVAKASSTIEVTGSSSFTYNGAAQGPATSNKTGSGGAVTYSYEGTGLTSYGPSATRPTQAGTYRATATVAADTNYNSATSAAFGFTIGAATLASGDITLTRSGDSYTASATGVSGFNFSYAGRAGTTYGPSGTAPTAGGFYTVTATSSDGNYSGSRSTDYIVAGPAPGNDTVTKPADNSRIKIPTATLLANDSRIDTDGTGLTDNLSITAVANGTGTAAISGAFVLFTPSAAASDSFTYTVTDAITGKTATGTVSVTTEAAPPSFDLQIVGLGTATYDGTQTSVTMDFIGVPNQNYTVEYKGDLSEAAWTSTGAQATGATGSFSVTITKAGDHTADWNGSMFFRAAVGP